MRTGSIQNFHMDGSMLPFVKIIDPVEKSENDKNMKASIYIRCDNYHEAFEAKRHTFNEMFSMLGGLSSTLIAVFYFVSKPVIRQLYF
jgi:hypothetical protein